MKTLIKKKNKYLEAYKIRRENGMEYLSLKWTTSLKKAGQFDAHNDWNNWLKDWSVLKGQCQLIPKWTEWDKYYASCINFMNYCEKTDYSLDQVKNIRNKWFIVFSKLLKSWNWNDSAINDLFEDYGTSVCIKEKYESYKEVLEHFISELSYCSDRMNVQRIQRCHGIFQHFISMYKENNKPKYEYRGIQFDGLDCFEDKKYNVAMQRLICKECSKKYTGNDLEPVKDSYWKNTTCCLCSKNKTSFHLYFKNPKEIKEIK